MDRVGNEATMDCGIISGHDLGMSFYHLGGYVFLARLGVTGV